MHSHTDAIDNSEVKPSAQRSRSVQLVLILLWLGLSALMLKAAHWQYTKGLKREALANQIASNENGTAKTLQSFQLTFLDTMSETHDWVHQKIQLPNLQTYQLNWQQLLLIDNRPHNGQVGVSIHIPMTYATSNEATHWLIDLGWHPYPLPKTQENWTAWLETLQQKVSDELKVGAEGKLIPDQAAHFVLANPLEQLSQQVYRLQKLDIAEMPAPLHQSFYPAVIKLDHPEHWGLSYLPYLIDFNPEKNFGYAVQWIGLTLALWILTFLYWRKHTRTSRGSL
jgi:cytochrome oxidase assembly protein ShyY1